MEFIAFKLTSSNGVGYSVLQCNIVIWFFSQPCLVKISRAISISFILAIPVLSIIGLFFEAICFNSGLLVISPEGTLK